MIIFIIVWFCQVCHTNPSERARFIRCIYNLLQSSSPAVRYEAAGTLVTLSSAPTAVKVRIINIMISGFYIALFQLWSKRCTVYCYPGHRIQNQFCTQSALSLLLGSHHVYRRAQCQLNRITVGKTIFFFPVLYASAKILAHLKVEGSKSRLCYKAKGFCAENGTKEKSLSVYWINQNHNICIKLYEWLQCQIIPPPPKKKVTHTLKKKNTERNGSRNLWTSVVSMKNRHHQKVISLMLVGAMVAVETYSWVTASATHITIKVIIGRTWGCLLLLLAQVTQSTLVFSSNITGFLQVCYRNAIRGNERPNCTKTLALAPFWFSKEHHQTTLMPFLKFLFLPTEIWYPCIKGTG